MSPRALAAAAFLPFALGTPAQGFETGYDYYRVCLQSALPSDGSSCDLFLRGVVTGVVAAEILLDARHKAFCIQGGIPWGQFELIVQQYARNHPTLLDRMPAGIILLALGQAYPCPP